jgi:hypothetical protein
MTKLRNFVPVAVNLVFTVGLILYSSNLSPPHPTPTVQTPLGFELMASTTCELFMFHIKHWMSVFKVAAS